MLDQTDPAHLLADLKHRRADLATRLATLQAQQDRLSQAEAAETEALTEIGELGRAEVAAMKAWAEAGADSPSPAIDHRKREKLTKALAVASARADAARGAGTDVQAALTAARSEDAQLGWQIELAAVAALTAQFQAERASELEVLAASVRARTAAVYGAHEFLRRRAEAYRDADRMPEATTIFRFLDRVGVKPPDFAPSIADVTAAVPVWAERFEELMR